MTVENNFANNASSLVENKREDFDIFPAQNGEVANEKAPSYSKHEFFKTKLLQIVEITWKGNSFSAIHNHNSDDITQGIALILEGEFRNTIFKKLPCTSIVEEKFRDYTKGEFIYFPPKTIHKMNNLNASIGRTLHFYTPSIQVMETFVVN